MSVIITNNRYYSDIAEAIRNISNTSTLYTPSQMASAIRSLSGNTLTTNSRIIVTAVSGGIVVAIKGSVSKTAVYSEGRYNIYNCGIGTWLVRFYKDGGYNESNVIIPSDADGRRFEYNLAL